MNTDARRAVFCVVMGSEDCADAAERLLRLGLRGDQEREVVRVAVECCLQEAAWNPYYAHLVTRLCSAERRHRATLLHCFWDQAKEVEGAGARRMANLARLGGAAIAGGALPPAALKVGRFDDSGTAREVLFWRLLLEQVFASCAAPADAAALFGRLAGGKGLGELRAALRRFLTRSVGPWLAAKDAGPGGGGEARLAALLRCCREAERALGSSTG
jgi:nucleolar MIF4G domain-containing protein 1